MDSGPAVAAIAYTGFFMASNWHLFNQIQGIKGRIRPSITQKIINHAKKFENAPNEQEKDFVSQVLDLTQPIEQIENFEGNFTSSFIASLLLVLCAGGYTVLNPVQSSKDLLILLQVLVFTFALMLPIYTIQLYLGYKKISSRWSG